MLLQSKPVANNKSGCVNYSRLKYLSSIINWNHIFEVSTSVECFVHFSGK